MFRAAVQRCVQRRSLHQSLGLRMSRTGPLLGDNGFEHRRYEVNRLFAIAMDEVEAARESIGTTYFPEDEIMAREAVEEVVRWYEALIKEGEAGKAVRSEMHMKMEQLQADLESLHDDEDEEDEG